LLFCRKYEREVVLKKMKKLNGMKKRVVYIYIAAGLEATCARHLEAYLQNIMSPIASSESRLRLLVHTPPEKLNMRSEATEVAGMARYFPASLAITGNVSLLHRHHSRGQQLYLSKNP